MTGVTGPDDMSPSYDHVQLKNSIRKRNACFKIELQVTRKELIHLRVFSKGTSNVIIRRSGDIEKIVYFNFRERYRHWFLFMKVPISLFLLQLENHVTLRTSSSILYIFGYEMRLWNLKICLKRSNEMSLNVKSIIW